MSANERYAKKICREYGVEPPADSWKYVGEQTIFGVAKAVLHQEALERWFDDNATDEQMKNRALLLGSTAS